MLDGNISNSSLYFETVLLAIFIPYILSEITANPLLDGITLSGGEPMLQVKPLVEICKEVKAMGLNIVVYSGFTYEEILKDAKKKELLQLCDMLIDGKFEQDKKSLALLYRGSVNQRLINVQESLKQGKVIEYQIIDNEVKI